jgi:hypothetical protein
MRKSDKSISCRQLVGLRNVALSGLLTTALFMPSAHAEESPNAVKILKEMSDHISSQKNLAVTFDSDIEVVTNELQKLQFTSSGQVQLSRPDKLRATRTGGYADGKTITINCKDKNVFAQIDSPGSADQLIDLLRDNYGVVHWGPISYSPQPLMK